MLPPTSITFGNEISSALPRNPKLPQHQYNNISSNTTKRSLSFGCEDDTVSDISTLQSLSSGDRDDALIFEIDMLRLESMDTKEVGSFYVDHLSHRLDDMPMLDEELTKNDIGPPLLDEKKTKKKTKKKTALPILADLDKMIGVITPSTAILKPNASASRESSDRGIARKYSERSDPGYDEYRFCNDESSLENNSVNNSVHSF